MISDLKFPDYKYRENMRIKSITIDKEILGGTPVFSGTRVPVQSLFDWLETETLNEFLENFPSVKRKQALEILRYANELIKTINKDLHENIA